MSSQRLKYTPDPGVLAAAPDSITIAGVKYFKSMPLAVLSDGVNDVTEGRLMRTGPSNDTMKVLLCGQSKAYHEWKSKKKPKKSSGAQEESGAAESGAAESGAAVSATRAELAALKPRKPYSQGLAAGQASPNLDCPGKRIYKRFRQQSEPNGLLYWWKLDQVVPHAGEQIPEPGAAPAAPAAVAAEVKVICPRTSGAVSAALMGHTIKPAIDAQSTLNSETVATMIKASPAPGMAGSVSKATLNRVASKRHTASQKEETVWTSWSKIVPYVKEVVRLNEGTLVGLKTTEGQIIYYTSIPGMLTELSPRPHETSPQSEIVGCPHGTQPAVQLQSGATFMTLMLVPGMCVVLANEIMRQIWAIDMAFLRKAKTSARFGAQLMVIEGMTPLSSISTSRTTGVSFV